MDMKLHTSQFKSSDELIDSFRDVSTYWQDHSEQVICKNESERYKLWMVLIDGNFMVCYRRYRMPDIYLKLSLYTLQDKSKLNEFYEIDESYYPVSCFIDAATAQQITIEYCKDPTQPPPSGNWFDEDELPWPSLDETREEWAARGVKLIWPKDFHY